MPKKERHEEHANGTHTSAATGLTRTTEDGFSALSFSRSVVPLVLILSLIEIEVALVNKLETIICPVV